MSSPLSHAEPQQVYSELMFALKNHFPVTAVREIVERCPNILEKTNQRLRCPLFDALSHGADLKVVRYLVEQRPSSLLAKERRGRCPLHAALENGARRKVIQYLVDTCPQALQERDGSGNLPAHTAVHSGASLRVLRNVVEPYPHALRMRNRSSRLPLTLALARSCRRPPPPEEEVDEEEEEDPSLALDVIRCLVEMCPESIGDQDKEGERALHYAAKCGAPPDVLALLLRHRPGALREATNDGLLPVHGAAGSDSPTGFASFQFLVHLWPESLQQRTRSGDLPLHMALVDAYRTNHTRNHVPLLDRVRYMLDTWPQAIRTTAGKDELIPLYRAVMEGAPHDVLGLLLEAWPESILELTKEGDSILHVDLRTEHMTLDTVRFLVGRDDRVVDVRSARDGSLPVHTYAGGGLSLDDGESFFMDQSALDYVRFLVERRPESVLARDDEGRLPLHRALRGASYDAPAIAEYLARRRPETLSVKTRQGLIPLHIAVIRFRGWLEDVQPLVELCPESLRVRDNNGNLAIHFAVTETSELVQYLAEQDPDSVLERNNDGLSPLHRLVVVADEWTSEAMEVASILVEHRPDVVAVGNDDGLLPLHSAAGRGDSSCLDPVEFLIEVGPDTAMTPARDGRLPLHCALDGARSTSTEVDVEVELDDEPAGPLPLVQLLVDAAPASLHVKDGRGMIPLQVAAANPCTQLDVLWYLMTSWPASVATLRRAAEGGEASPSSARMSPPFAPKRPRLG